MSDSVTPWIIACQAPLSMGFPSQENWSEGKEEKKNWTGVSCHFLLQGTFPTQELNLDLLLWEVDSLPLTHQGSTPMVIHSEKL